MKKKLMIVDDSRFIFEEMKHMLEESDYEIVDYAKSGEDAIEKIEQGLPDLITMDVILPGISGMEASEIILQRWPQAKIVVVSSLAYDETVDQAKRVGARGFIFKPFTQEELISSLDRCIQGVDL